MLLPTETPDGVLLAFWKARGWSGYVFAASANPETSSKKLAMSPSSTVYGRQCATKYVTFEQILQAAFAAD